MKDYLIVFLAFTVLVLLIILIFRDKMKRIEIKIGQWFSANFQMHLPETVSPKQVLKNIDSIPIKAKLDLPNLSETKNNQETKGPDYYFKEIKKLPPAVRETAFKKMIGMEVEWNLKLGGFTDISNNKTMISFKDPQSGFISAYTQVANNTYPHLNLLAEDAPVLVKGIIRSAGSLSFELEKTTIKDI